MRNEKPISVSTWSWIDTALWIGMILFIVRAIAH